MGKADERNLHLLQWAAGSHLGGKNEKNEYKINILKVLKAINRRPNLESVEMPKIGTIKECKVVVVVF